jgi:hypothetical protein
VQRRTIAQLALVFIGLFVWGYGARTDDSHITLAGLSCFALAFVLRLLKRKEADPRQEEP